MLVPIVALYAVAWATPEPRLTGPGSPLDPGAAATFTLAPGGGAAWVDGCVAVELERREGERWVPVADAISCDGSTPARPIGSALTVSVATPGPGEYRGVAVVGKGCVEGRSFALSACSDTRTARSEPFTVRMPRVGDQR